MVVLFLAVLLLTACSSSEELDEVEKPVQLVTTRLNFSLPSRIVGKRSMPQTRMSGDIVQADGEKGEFRGIDDVHMLCFNQYPQPNSTKLGGIINMRTYSDSLEENVTKEDPSLTKEIEIPVGTSYFAFYARSADYPMSHEDRMKYGILETVGLSKNTYTGNRGVRFRPVPICNSSDGLGGSFVGHRLLDLLNKIAGPMGPEAAPNDKLSTANNLYLNEAWEKLKELRVLSSQSVEIFLGYLNKLLTQEFPEEQGKQLAEAILAKIAECCEDAPEPNNDKITLKEQYQGYPADIHLPVGTARIQWNEEKNRFEPASEQDYGKGLSIPKVTDYVYPMNLQYQVFSDIVVSDTLVMNEVTDDGGMELPDSARFKNWSELIDKGYKDAQKSVQPTTQSVAMCEQVKYAVGHLALRARLYPSDNYYDARGQYVNVSNGFTLKGYIVGGQREVDYNFQPVANAHVYAIYDTELAEGTTNIIRRTFSDDDVFNYILGLGTPSNENIYLAMELVNNCEDFYGADGLIAKGSTFYLVANLDPSQGQGYNVNDLNKIFIKDVATRVNLIIPGGYPDRDGDGKPDPDNDDQGHPKPINGLATATYGLPDLQIPHPTVGLSVDLSWGEGLWFDDIEL